MKGSNPLLSLWNSTFEFHQRFGQPRPNPFAAVSMVIEEVNEVIEAAKLASASSDNNDELAEEIADLMVTAMGLMMAFGDYYPTLEKAVYRVIEKNNAKTEETHERRADGKIARKPDFTRKNTATFVLNGEEL